MYPQILGNFQPPQGAPPSPRDRQRSDPGSAAMMNKPEYEAQQLGKREGILLNRDAQQMGPIDSGGLDAAHFNQIRSLQAQQDLMNGPSLAGMKGQQAFGQAQQTMMGNRDPRAMHMGVGAGQLGAAANAAGNAVGDEWMKGQQGIAGSYNTLGQGDIASQQGLEQLKERQRQLDLQQRGQNLGTAQGYEQNYFNEQNAYTQQAQAEYAAYLARQQGLQTATTQTFGAGAKAVGGALGLGL